LFSRNPEYSSASVLIELRPALSEITVADEDDLYFAGLRGFYDSLEQLGRHLMSERIGIRWWMSSYADNGAHIHRRAPPETVQFILPLNVPAAVVLTYKAIKWWADHTNGRKVRVKFDGIEVEASQLSEEDLFELLNKVVEYRERAETSKRELESRDAFAKFRIADSDQSDNERMEISRLVSRMDAEVRKRYREKRGLTRPGDADPGPQRPMA
jgi:hypothetical protein